jgi:uncharacterized membrane protein
VVKVSDKQNKISILDMEENVAAAVCYIPVVGVLPAIAFLVTEKNETVRWNAMQAVVLWVAVVVADMVLRVSIVAMRLIPLINLIGMVVVPLALAIKANQKEQTRLPFLGEVVDKLLKGRK